MVDYEWICHDCKLIWSRSYPIAKNPTRTKCPQCKKLCEKNWKPTPVHFKGGVGSGWTTKSGGELHGSSDEMNKAMQEGCNKRMSEGWKDYAHYSPSKGYLDSVGATRLSDEQVKKNIEVAKKTYQPIYDKAGIDLSKKYKPQ